MATAIDAKGDLIGGTGADAFDRLAVGTNGQVLSADSTATTGLKWITPATAGSLVKVSRSSFSNVAGTNIDSVFSSTYKAYLVIIEDIFAATNTDDLLFQFRYGSTTESNANYYGNYRYMNYSTTSQTIVSVNGGTSMTLNLNTGFSGGSFPSAVQIWVAGVGNANEAGKLWGSGMDAANYNQFDFGGWAAPTPKQTYTGFRLSSSSTNITGTVTVYGLAL